MNQLSNKQVLELLPHRYPFLMIDRVENFTESEIVAIKNFTINEPYVQGHFPGMHIMPGVMMVEAMAQASALLGIIYMKNCMTEEEGDKYFSRGLGFLFVSADKIRFRKVVYPGHTMKIHSKLIKRARELFEFECKIIVDGELAGNGLLKAVGGIPTNGEDKDETYDKEELKQRFKYLELPKKQLENT